MSFKPVLNQYRLSVFFEIIIQGDLNDKKFIASSVALILLPSVLSGCTANTFRYNSGDNHEIVVEGTVSYNYLKECYYVEIENPDYNKTEYYIANKDGYYSSDTHTLVGYFYYGLTYKQRNISKK